MSIKTISNQMQELSISSVSEKSAKMNEQTQDKEANTKSTLQEKTVIEAVEKANKKLEGADREFEFSIHEKTKEIMVKVINKNSKEVIREIPSEKILDMVVAMCEAAGLFIDERV